MKNEKCCSQLSMYFKKTQDIRKADESLVWSEKLDSSFKPALLRSETSTTSESSIDK
jgi:hypothetical protein